MPPRSCQVPPGAGWFNQPEWQLVDDVLEMHASEGSDLWQRPSYGYGSCPSRDAWLLRLVHGPALSTWWRPVRRGAGPSSAAWR